MGLNYCKPSTATPDVIHTSADIFLVMNGEDDKLLHLLFECLALSKKVISPPVRCVKICAQERDGLYQESRMLVPLGCLRCQFFLPSIMPKP